MVKVGIAGAETPISGEIIRLLINHPETDMVSLYSPNLYGRNVTSLHHGLIGESHINFTDKLILEDLDLLILANTSELNENLLSKLVENNNVKIILLGKNLIPGINHQEIGLSEINRKALVRGAQIAYIPSPAIVSSLVALIPLSHFLLLTSDIDIEVTLPKDLYDSISIEKEEKEISEQLKKGQVSFQGKINLKINAVNPEERGVTTIIKLKNSLPLEELEKIYDETYDDHNFSFLSRSNIDVKEVEGTQKIIIFLDKPDNDNLIIKAVSDARLRGGAGDVVHVLNLFFGLHEKTGLYLKSSHF